MVVQKKNNVYFFYIFVYKAVNIRIHIYIQYTYIYYKRIGTYAYSIYISVHIHTIYKCRYICSSNLNSVLRNKKSYVKHEWLLFVACNSLRIKIP